MKTPWINTQPARPKEKTVFKSSISKVPKKPIDLDLKNIKEEPTETGNDNLELDNIGTTNNPDENNDIDKEPELSDRIDSNHFYKIEETTEDKYSFKPAEFSDEMKVTSPAELTDGVHMYKQGKIPDENNDIIKEPELSDRIESNHVYKKEETIESKNSFKPAEFANEMKVTSPAELTDGVHMYKQGKIPDKKYDIIKEPELSDRIDSKHVYKKEETIESKNSFKPAEFANEMKVTSPAELTDGVHMYEQGKVCYLTKNSPFSVHVEIDNFLHDPICGDIAQNTFEYHDKSNKKTPEFDTKLFHTTAYYPEQPDCRLVCSNIHEIVFLTDDQNENKNNKGNHYKSVVVPIHDSLFTKAEESKNNAYVHIRVPVVLGEYKIEICLEEHITFKEKIMRIKEISKEVVLTHFSLIPTVFSQTLNNGTRTVLKGNLFIEGYIRQKIEYTSFFNRNTESVTPLNQLYQKMAVELIIHILQVQQVRVKR